MMRFDSAIARLSILVAGAVGMEGPGGRKLRLQDFEPYMDEPEATPEDIMKALRGG